MQTSLGYSLSKTGRTSLPYTHVFYEKITIKYRYSSLVSNRNRHLRMDAPGVRADVGRD